LQLLGSYEDSPEMEIRGRMHDAAVEVLGGQWISIWHKWETRLDQMRDALTRAQPFTFQPCLRISPVNTAVLSQALSSGRFTDKAPSEKKTFHILNTFTLVLSRAELWKSQPKAPKPMRLPPFAMSA